MRPPGRRSRRRERRGPVLPGDCVTLCAGDPALDLAACLLLLPDHEAIERRQRVGPAPLAAPDPVGRHGHRRGVRRRPAPATGRRCPARGPARGRAGRAVRRLTEPGGGGAAVRRRVHHSGVHQGPGGVRPGAGRGRGRRAARARTGEPRRLDRARRRRLDPGRRHVHHHRVGRHRAHRVPRRQRRRHPPGDHDRPPGHRGRERPVRHVGVPAGDDPHDLRRHPPSGACARRQGRG